MTLYFDRKRDTIRKAIVNWKGVDEIWKEINR